MSTAKSKKTNGVMPSAFPQTHWRERPHLNMNVAAEIAGLSPASLYRAAAEKKLEFVRLGGRTMVQTKSFEKWLEAAEPWIPSNRCDAAIAARWPRAAQARS